MQQNLWKSFIALVLFFYLTQPPAQAQETKKDSITRYKWEIGTDLLWLIDKNSAPRNSVFLRRNFTTKSGKLRAWRLRVSGNIRDYTDSSGPILSTDSMATRTEKNYGFFLRPGYEWQKQYGRFQLNYGIDLHLLWQRFDFQGNNFPATSNPNGIIYEKYNGYQQTWQSGLIGFFGAKYFISSRWLVNGEATLSTMYEWRRTLQDNYFTNGPAVGEKNGGANGKSNSLTFNLNPIYVIQVSYLFN